MSVQIYEGSALDVLRTLPSESVQCVVTSPPYFQLRDYGVDGQIGLESTPAAFIAALLDVFDEVRRVLRPDGLCFVNLGDSYSGSGKGGHSNTGIVGNHERRQGFDGGKRWAGSGLNHGDGIPAKNLLLIPERFAIGMQERGWTVRSRIAWCKTSAMPESVHGSFYTRHRVTMGEYENLRRLRVDTGRGSVSSPKSPVQAVQDARGTGLSTDGSLSTGEGSISSQREGARNGAGSRGTSGCPGAAAHSQQFAPRPDQQSEIRGNGEGQGNPSQGHCEVHRVGTRQGSTAKAGCSPEAQSGLGQAEESSGPSLPTNRGWEGRACGGDAPATSGYRGVYGRAADLGRVVSDPEGESLPLLLLQREDEAVDGSRHPAEQGRGAPQGERGAGVHPLQQPKEQPADDALVDCPGCPKCEPHGGLILKKGSGRPTAAWEHIWVFSKSGDYFWDDTAVKTATGASLRNYWVLGPEPLKDAHYASFPSAIPRTAISAGTSEKGACPACGAPWVRVTEKGAVRASDGRDRYGAYVYEPRDRMVQGDHCRSGPSGTAALPRREHKLLGWSPSCSCPPAEPRPCVVLDPFLGSGTTLLAADRLGRSGVGIELSPTYAAMARKRIESDAPMVSEPVEVVPAGDQLDLFSEATA